MRSKFDEEAGSITRYSPICGATVAEKVTPVFVALTVGDVVIATVVNPPSAVEKGVSCQRGTLSP